MVGNSNFATATTAATQQRQDGEDPTPTERAEEEWTSKVWPLYLVHLHIPAAALLFSVPQPTLVRTAGRLCGRADDGIGNERCRCSP